MGLNSSREVRANKLFALGFGHGVIDGGQMCPLLGCQLSREELRHEGVGVWVPFTGSVPFSRLQKQVIFEGKTWASAWVVSGFGRTGVGGGTIRKSEGPAQFHF